MKNKESSRKAPPSSKNTFSSLLAPPLDESIPLSAKRKAVLASTPGSLTVVRKGKVKSSNLRTNRPKVKVRQTRTSLLRVQESANSPSVTNEHPQKANQYSSYPPPMPSPAWDEGGDTLNSATNTSAATSGEPWQNMSSRENNQNRQSMSKTGLKISQNRHVAKSGARGGLSESKTSTKLPKTVDSKYTLNYKSSRKQSGSSKASSEASEDRSTSSGSGKPNDKANSSALRLLPGWEATIDQKTGKTYYFNRETGARTWDWRNVVSQAPQQHSMYTPRVKNEKATPRRPKESHFLNQNISSPRARRVKEIKRKR